MWLRTKVVFIPIAGKPLHCTPKDFKPISQSSFPLKTMKRLISLHINLNISPNDISGSQHAYGKDRSTNTALHEITTFVEKALSDREYALIAFL
ncbi:hypothetical protein KR026_008199, partial [Drosophila bipectinata]